MWRPRWRLAENERLRQRTCQPAVAHLIYKHFNFMTRSSPGIGVLSWSARQVVGWSGGRMVGWSGGRMVRWLATIGEQHKSAKVGTTMAQRDGSSTTSVGKSRNF